jgi:hypothetical protein
MKRRIVLSLALLAGLSMFASANAAHAFHFGGRGHGCAGPSCCAPEPSCCDTCGPRHRGLLAGLFHRGGCCDTGCDVGCAEPACGAPVETTCCAPAPTCCDSGCGRRHHGLFGWLHRHRGCGCNSCDTGCDVGCAEPACAAPVETSCCAPEPTCCAPAATCCDNGCGRRHLGLFSWLHRNRGCCNTCDTGCDMGCGGGCGCGG